jgi:hypothetical protein
VSKAGEMVFVAKVNPARKDIIKRVICSCIVIVCFV